MANVIKTITVNGTVYEIQPDSFTAKDYFRAGIVSVEGCGCIIEYPLIEADTCSNTVVIGNVEGYYEDGPQGCARLGIYLGKGYEGDDNASMGDVYIGCGMNGEINICPNYGLITMGYFPFQYDIRSDYGSTYIGGVWGNDVDYILIGTSENIQLGNVIYYDGTYCYPNSICLCGGEEFYITMKIDYDYESERDYQTINMSAEKLNISTSQGFYMYAMYGDIDMYTECNVNLYGYEHTNIGFDGEYGGQFTTIYGGESIDVGYFYNGCDYRYTAQYTNYAGCIRIGCSGYTSEVYIGAVGGTNVNLNGNIYINDESATWQDITIGCETFRVLVSTGC